MLVALLLSSICQKTRTPSHSMNRFSADCAATAAAAVGNTPAKRRCFATNVEAVSGAISPVYIMVLQTFSSNPESSTFQAFPIQSEHESYAYEVRSVQPTHSSKQRSLSKLHTSVRDTSMPTTRKPCCGCKPCVRIGCTEVHLISRSTQQAVGMEDGSWQQSTEVDFTAVPWLPSHSMEVSTRLHLSHWRSVFLPSPYVSSPISPFAFKFATTRSNWPSYCCTLAACQRALRTIQHLRRKVPTGAP